MHYAPEPAWGGGRGDLVVDLIAVWTSHRVTNVCVFHSQSLSADLAAAKLETKATRNDILHQQNVAQGRDKYKTLKQIRMGNTKLRIDMFESM